MSGNITLFYGAVINPQTLTSYDVLPRCLLAVGNTGNIDWMVEDVAPHDLQQVLAQHGCNDEYLVELKDGEFLLPGFVDTHTVSKIFPRTEIMSLNRLPSTLLKYLISERTFSDVPGTIFTPDCVNQWTAVRAIRLARKCHVSYRSQVPRCRVRKADVQEGRTDLH